MEGPKFCEKLDFVEVIGLGPDGRDPRIQICPCCGEGTFVLDVDTGLCRSCWRGWRFSARG